MLYPTKLGIAGSDFRLVNIFYFMHFALSDSGCWCLISCMILILDGVTHTEMSDSIPVTSSEDWSAAFGFKESDDDLGNTINTILYVCIYVNHTCIST